MILFTETHEWVEVKGSIATIGITALLQKEIGQIVFVELPKIGQILQKDTEAAILESTKAALDTYAPLSGTVTAINHQLIENPSLLNTSPEKEGWLYQITMSNADELGSLSAKEP